MNKCLRGIDRSPDSAELFGGWRRVFKDTKSTMIEKRCVSTVSTCHSGLLLQDGAAVHWTNCADEFRVAMIAIQIVGNAPSIRRLACRIGFAHGGYPPIRG